MYPHYDEVFALSKLMPLCCDLCFLYLISSLFVVCCMLLCLGRSRAASLFHRLSPNTRTAQVSTSTSTRSNRTTAMFQNAVKKHNANTGAKKTLSQQLFSSSPPVPRDQQPRYENPHQTSKSRPLSVGSANVVKPRARPNSHSATCGTGNNGVKRSAGGLVKALSAENTFTGLASNNSQDNPILIDDASAAKKGISNAKSDVFFDENDFDSDLELDVEDPAGKGTVYYPELPQVSISTAIPPPVVYPTLPRQAPHLAHERSHTADSGYVSQLFPIGGTNIKRPSPQGKDDEPLPWSSSPLEHFRKPPNLNQFSYKPAEPVARQDIEEVARPKKKRRQLPWATTETQNDADGKDGAHTTPLPKEGKKSTYPWTTTASAIKEQQRALRQANKKSVKSTSADPEAVDSKTNRFGQRAKDKVSTVFLSDEQRHVLNLIVENKKSVFFTGAAGTGKSVLLREIIAALRKKYNKEPDRVAVTASTGLAACNVGGVTLHSFAGIGLGKEPANELAKKIKRNAKAKHRWMRTKVLIVDEISMVDGDLFDKLEELARNLRNNGRPFGGIQLVITGDFFQLPPVPDYGRIAKFAFDAATWNTSIEHTIGLHHVFRQKDPEFARMLNEMREGRLMPDSIRKFKDMNRALNFRDDMEATELLVVKVVHC